MPTVPEAFEKFKSKISVPTKKESDDASRRQREIRALMDEHFDVERDFLSGSYARHTKTKPLKDVDIFCVLGEGEKHFRKKVPRELLNAVAAVLEKKYGKENVSVQRRSVSVNFGTTEDEVVMSFDVVPAFDAGDYYEVPDTKSAEEWTKTDPEIHKEKASEKHASYSYEWKGLVRMVKTWNRVHSRPVKPSFLLEVMALELFVGDFGKDYRYELKGFFSSAAERIFDDWPDPAGLGQHISDGMTQTEKLSAQTALRSAETACLHAIQVETRGRTGEALEHWQRLFGPQFVKS
jgi:predicted nucleotidyltransferase